MASGFRYGQQLTSQFLTFNRNSLHGGSIASLVPIYNRNAYTIKRNFHNYHWDRRQQQRDQKILFGLNVYELISIGCVSVAVYNWKKYRT